MADKPGWIVITEALGSDPNDHSGRNYTEWTNRGFGVIVRLNNGYAPVGTIPDAGHYSDFARRCANFVGASPGCERVIIGNEPNHLQERPYGEIITPAQYAKCFDLCYRAIKGVSSSCEVIVAGPAPWDASTKYPGNMEGDWVKYFDDQLSEISKCDAIAIHTYTHGSDPDLITDESTMDGYFRTHYYNFRAYQDFLAVVPSRFVDLPVYITETDQVNPWKNENQGWVQEAYREINRWNHSLKPTIHCLCLYRSNTDDQWSFTHLDGVKDDFRAAVEQGYMIASGSTPTPPSPEPPLTDLVPPPEEAREIDPKLIARGVKFNFVEPAVGSWYWRVVEAEWLENAASEVGPDHHILGQILRENVETAGIQLLVSWPSGSTEITSKSNDPNASYNYDYGMSASLNEYSIQVNDGFPSDAVSGIGMGKNGNPREHTSTWIVFEWTQAPDVVVPPLPPMEGHTEYVVVELGANLREVPVVGTILVAVPYGHRVEVTDTTRGTDGYFWKRSTYSGLTGWIRGDLLSVEDPAPLPVPPPSSELIHPLLGGVITQNFYQNPQDYAVFNLPGHGGTDLGGKPLGTPVLSAADGRVVNAGWDPEGYGSWVKVDAMGYGAEIMYCHLSEVDVATGQFLQAGNQVGKLGATGNATGVHLHIEVRLTRVDGSYLAGTPMKQGRVDPRSWFISHGLTL